MIPASLTMMASSQRGHRVANTLNGCEVRASMFPDHLLVRTHASVAEADGERKNAPIQAMDDGPRDTGAVHGEGLISSMGTTALADADGPTEA